MERYDFCHLRHYGCVQECNYLVSELVLVMVQMSSIYTSQLLTSEAIHVPAVLLSILKPELNQI